MSLNCGECRLKDTLHWSCHRSAHLRVNRNIEEGSGCAWRDIHFGRGKKSEWAGATPLSVAFRRPKEFGVAPARSRICVMCFCRVHVENDTPCNAVVMKGKEEPEWQC
jgi:hypothetical protein